MLKREPYVVEQSTIEGLQREFGSCGEIFAIGGLFPRRVEAQTTGAVNLATALHIFRAVRNVVIREDSGRIIGTWIGKTPTAILQTKNTSSEAG